MSYSDLIWTLVLTLVYNLYYSNLAFTPSLVSSTKNKCHQQNNMHHYTKTRLLVSIELSHQGPLQTCNRKGLKGEPWWRPIVNRKLCYPSTCPNIYLYFSTHTWHYINVFFGKFFVIAHQSTSLITFFPSQYKSLLTNSLILHHLSHKMNYFHCIISNNFLQFLMFSHHSMYEFCSA